MNFRETIDKPVDPVAHEGLADRLTTADPCDALVAPNSRDLAAVSEVGVKEKIQILLAEYGALRAQMLQRNTLINQSVAGAATLLAAVLSLAVTGHVRVAVILAVVLLVPLLFVFRLNESDMLVTAKRLAELTEEINKRAGEILLKTENSAGFSTLGYIPNFAYGVRPFDRLGAPLLRLWRRRKDLD